MLRARLYTERVDKREGKLAPDKIMHGKGRSKRRKTSSGPDYIRRGLIKEKEN